MGVQRIRHNSNRIKELKEKRKREFSKRREVPLIQRHEVKYEKLEHGKTADPWSLIDQLEVQLDKLDEYYPRSTQQLECHKWFIVSCLPQLFGDAIEVHRTRLMRRYRVSNINNIICVSAGRRTGKTVSVCMYAAVWLRVVDGADIAIFSIALRQSTAISAMVKIMLIKLFGADVIVRCNQETMVVKNIHGGTNKLMSLPGASEVLIISYYFYKQKKEGVFNFIFYSIIISF